MDICLEIETRITVTSCCDVIIMTSQSYQIVPYSISQLISAVHMTPSPNCLFPTHKINSSQLIESFKRISSLYRHECVGNICVLHQSLSFLPRGREKLMGREPQIELRNATSFLLSCRYLF